MANIVLENNNKWATDGIFDTDIAKTQKEINKILFTQNLSNVPVLFIGDSYNKGNGGVDGQGWGYYFQQMTGCVGTFIYQNGGGFAAVGNSNATYPNMTYADLISNVSSNDYKYIIAQSGWNDASTGRNSGGASAIEVGVTNFISNAKTKWPNAKIIIFATNNDTYAYTYKANCLRTIGISALKNGTAAPIDSYLWMQNTSYNASDGIHLTDEGYRLMAKYLVAYISGWNGELPFLKIISPTISTVSGVTIGNNFKVYADKNWAYLSGDISLTASQNNWVTLLSGLPETDSSCIATFVQWGTSYTRPIRLSIEPNGTLVIRYGASGNYSVIMTYPIKQA